MFGKPGRPNEDRLQRRREIWATVGPLIERHGARNLTMRQAAAAAFISLGGLYHYFPSKRSLVLFGLDPQAMESFCLDFKAHKYSSPDAATEAFIRYFGDTQSFLRPAVLGALELGAEGFLSHLEAGVNMGLDGFIETLRLVLPEAGSHDLRMMAPSLRRLAFAGLLDRAMSRQELEEELRAVVDGLQGRSFSALVAS